MGVCSWARRVPVLKLKKTLGCNFMFDEKNHLSTIYYTKVSWMEKKHQITYILAVFYRAVALYTRYICKICLCLDYINMIFFIEVWLSNKVSRQISPLPFVNWLLHIRTLCERIESFRHFSEYKFTVIIIYYWHVRDANELIVGT